MEKENLPLVLLDKKKLKKIKLIVLDVDGILVPRGTKIKQKADMLSLQFKRINKELLEKIKKLHNLGFCININSGRSLYMLQQMFSGILGYVSFTYENGSATWYKGKIYQHVNSIEFIKELLPKIKKLKDKNIRGIEPKEFIITIHCKKPSKKIETLIARYKDLYAIWNGEAYDIGIKGLQTKARGLKEFMKILKLKKENVLALGDNYNDRELLKLAGISITADPSRVPGHFFIPLSKKRLPGKILLDHILKISKFN